MKMSETELPMAAILLIGIPAHLKFFTIPKDLKSLRYATPRTCGSLPFFWKGNALSGGRQRLL